MFQSTGLGRRKRKRDTQKMLDMLNDGLQEREFWQNFRCTICHARSPVLVPSVMIDVQAWVAVDFEEVRIAIGVKQNVNAQNLKTHHTHIKSKHASGRRNHDIWSDLQLKTTRALESCWKTTMTNGWSQHFCHPHESNEKSPRRLRHCMVARPIAWASKGRVMQPLFSPLVSKLLSRPWLDATSFP